MILSANKEMLPTPTPSAHASCVARVRGETWVAWFGGTREGAPDVKIWLSRRTNEGWTEPIRFSASDDMPHWNPVLQPLEDGALLYFKIGRHIPEWRTMMVELGPDGQPLSPVRELAPGDVGGRGPVRNKCLALPDGRLLAPASTERMEATPEQPVRWTPFIDVSEDGGRTFPRACPVPIAAAGPEEEAPLPPNPALPDNALPLRPARVLGRGAIQPALWRDEKGVHLLMRSSEGCVMRSDSADGETWSPACRTNLPNNNSGIDLVRLEDGRILLCLNPTSGDKAPRTPLWLYLSEDGGASFRPFFPLEEGEGEYSYPSLACEGTTLYVSYTWKRQGVAAWEIRL